MYAPHFRWPFLIAQGDLVKHDTAEPPEPTSSWVKDEMIFLVCYLIVMVSSWWIFITS